MSAIKTTMPQPENSVLLVLGSDILPDGSLSDDARATLELAVATYRRQPGKTIFSGAHSYEAVVAPRISEAQAMKDAAVRLGVPAADIFVETESKDTIGNIYFTKTNLLEPLGIKHLRVLGTSRHSQARLDYILQKILGPKYAYDYVVRPGGWGPDSEHERISLQRAQAWFDTIPAGDNQSIYAAMRLTHPGYNGSDPTQLR